MKFYEFSQNNSGGIFDVDENVCHRLFIEAETEAQAEEKAFSLGVYYDGCDIGMDCSCCGDRWYSPEELELPYYNGSETVEGVAQYLADTYGWTSPDARIFYADGAVKEIFSEGK